MLHVERIGHERRKHNADDNIHGSTYPKTVCKSRTHTNVYARGALNYPSSLASFIRRTLAKLTRHWCSTPFLSLVSVSLSKDTSLGGSCSHVGRKCRVGL